MRAIKAVEEVVSVPPNISYKRTKNVAAKATIHNGMSGGRTWTQPATKPSHLMILILAKIIFSQT